MTATESSLALGLVPFTNLSLSLDNPFGNPMARTLCSFTISTSVVSSCNGLRSIIDSCRNPGRAGTSSCSGSGSNSAAATNSPKPAAVRLVRVGPLEHHNCPAHQGVHRGIAGPQVVQGLGEFGAVSVLARRSASEDPDAARARDGGEPAVQTLVAGTAWS